MTNPDTPQELREQIKDIKLRAIGKFKYNHNDGDIAIYDAVEEMSSLIETEATRREEQLLDELEANLGILHPYITPKDVRDFINTKRQAIKKGESEL